MVKTCFDQSPYYTLARDFYENEPLKLRTFRKTSRVWDGGGWPMPSLLDFWVLPTSWRMAAG